jgi:HK97 family phage portal protein
MQILGINITRTKALNTVGTTLRHGWRRILESFSGAWQMNVEETRGELITYPTLYACIYRISSDIGKLPYRLRRRMDTGVWQEATSPAYDPVLRKPNGFQTAGQFREYWMVTKLTNGNTYVLKRRDDRGVVIELYVLDPERVLPMVSDAGFVYYQLQIDPLNTLPKGYPAEGLIVPASEIIHDRCMTIHHPLIGIPPLAAAHWPALKNMKILRSATEFFGNNAQPGGILTAPAGMSDKDAEAVKSYWATNFTGTNAGRVAIVGADMKFTPFAMKSIDAQMVEQMRYSDEQICQPFGIPPFMVGIGSIPAGLGVDGVYQLYYQNALQTHIEHKEALLDEGLRVAAPLGIELDLEPLLRMDEGKRADVATKLIKGVGSTNEVRSKYFNWGPLTGGDTVYMQQQDFPLDQVRLNKITQPVEPPSAEVSEEDQAAIEEAKAIIATQKAITAMRRAALPEGANV